MCLHASAAFWSWVWVYRPLFGLVWGSSQKFADLGSRGGHLVYMVMQIGVVDLSAVSGFSKRMLCSAIHDGHGSVTL